MEHGLEVHLPFIWKVFGPKVKIIPLIVGDIDLTLFLHYFMICFQTQRLSNC